MYFYELVEILEMPENFNTTAIRKIGHMEYFEYDFDLVLSGHTHGGQGRIPFILNGFFAPEQGYFPKLAGGLYDFGENKLIISRGLSRENTIIPRIFNRPELVFVSVKGKNAPYVSLADFPRLNKFIWNLKVKLKAVGEYINKSLIGK